eukprot:2293627-Prymnesium_polylepis.1
MRAPGETMREDGGARSICRALGPIACASHNILEHAAGRRDQSPRAYQEHPPSPLSSSKPLRGLLGLATVPLGPRYQPSQSGP